MADAMTVTSEALLAGLDPEQREAALAGRGLVALDVDLGHLDPVPGELPLQVPAEAAPGGGVHRQLAGQP